MVDTMFQTILFVMSAIMVVAGAYLLAQGLLTRNRVLKKIRSQDYPSWIMPNWGLFLRWDLQKEPQKAYFVLQEIAGTLKSETAFFLIQSKQVPKGWIIPKGWIYSEREFGTNFILHNDLEIIRKAIAAESLILDVNGGDTIPDPLSERGIKSVIAVSAKLPRCEALLMVCNSKERSGRAPYEVSYTRADNELAVVMTRLLFSRSQGLYKLIQDM